MTRYFTKGSKGFRTVAATIAFAATLPQLAAAGVLYECDLNTRIKNGWVSPKTVFVFDDNGKTTVIDNVILGFYEKPMPARVSKRGETLRITWNIAAARDSRGQIIPTIRYVATLNQASKKVSIAAKPASAPQRWSAKGACKTRRK